MRPTVKMPQRGFTLIELSIVLVVIALLVGGIVIGRDLIQATTLNKQVRQVEQLKTAIFAFKSKFSHLPGDLPASLASNFGLLPRTGANGRGDGDGRIEISGGNCQDAAFTESLLFWTDLSMSGLIEASLNTEPAPGSTADPSTYLPVASIGRGTTVGAYCFNAIGPQQFMTFVRRTNQTVGFYVFANAYTPQEVFYIDTKIDDGLPQGGALTAVNSSGGGLNYGNSSNACQVLSGIHYVYNTATRTMADTIACGFNTELK